MGCIDNSSGCGCHLSGGTCLSVTGDGSVGNPYVVSIVLDPSGSNILSCGGSGLLALSAMPVGAMIDYPSNTPPSGWLSCNGQSVSRATYSALNALAALASYAAPWGPGDGVNTFNVPDVQAIFRVGVSGSDPDYVLGATGGEKKHILTLAELAAHDHGNTGNESAFHTHAISAVTGAFNQQTTTAGIYLVGQTGGNNSGTESASHTHQTVAAGSGTAHENRPPYKAFNCIIKT